MLVSAYPEDRLVPQVDYLFLDCAHFVSTGYLIRRLDHPAVTDAAGMIDEKSFKFPQGDHLVRHFSVSLLGTYEVYDACWKIINKGERAEVLHGAWVPGVPGICPSPDDATLAGDNEWGFFWLPIASLHGQRFQVGNAIYSCQVVHQPTHCNFWHFELRFFDEQGKDAKEDKYPGKIASGIRAKLMSVASTVALPPAPWPEPLYRTLLSQ